VCVCVYEREREREALEEEIVGQKWIKEENKNGRNPLLAEIKEKSKRNDGAIITGGALSNGLLTTYIISS
jgi:hypothetical protein